MLRGIISAKKMRHSTISKAKIHPHTLYAILVIGFIFTLHLTLPAYFNSSYLALFTSPESVSILYSAASAILIVGFLTIHYILERFGGFKTALFFIGVDILGTAGLILMDSFWPIAISFVMMTIAVNMIGFCIDIFLEKNTAKAETGGVRGLFLTVINVAWVIAPMLGGFLVDGNDYKAIFTASLLLLLPLVYLIHKNFDHFKDPKYHHTSIYSTLKNVLVHKDLKLVFVANIILNVFYAWMVIYAPMYLNETIGFSWESIGVMFTIMLLPFVLFDIPAGRMADGGLGEKELMTGSFIVLGVSTMALYFLDIRSFWLWTLGLFITRIGAAIAEVMIETYFFKKVDAKDANTLSAFRVTRPMSYVLVPAITAIGLLFTDYRGMFPILGLVCLFAVFLTMRIRDTA